MSGLSSRARRLLFSRGLGSPGVERSIGLVYLESVCLVSRAGLGDGDRVICDYTILERRWPDSPDSAVGFERVSSDRSELGVVRAWNGDVIGEAVFSQRRVSASAFASDARVLAYGAGDGDPGLGALLRFTWPEGLPASDPEASAGA